MQITTATFLNERKWYLQETHHQQICYYCPNPSLWLFIWIFVFHDSMHWHTIVFDDRLGEAATLAGNTPSINLLLLPEPFVVNIDLNFCVTQFDELAHHAFRDYSGMLLWQLFDQERFAVGICDIFGPILSQLERW